MLALHKRTRSLDNNCSSMVAFIFLLLDARHHCYPVCALKIQVKSSSNIETNRSKREIKQKVLLRIRSLVYFTSHLFIFTPKTISEFTLMCIYMVLIPSDIPFSSYSPSCSQKLIMNDVCGIIFHNSISSNLSPSSLYDVTWTPPSDRNQKQSNVRTNAQTKLTFAAAKFGHCLRSQDASAILGIRSAALGMLPCVLTQIGLCWISSADPQHKYTWQGTDRHTRYKPHFRMACFCAGLQPTWRSTQSPPALCL